MVTNENLCSIHFQAKKRHGYISELDNSGGPLDKMLASKLVNLFKKPAAIEVWQWIYENFKLPESERKGFQGECIDFDIMPDAKELLSNLDNPDVKRIILVFSAQSGKTLLLLSIMKWFLEHRRATGLFYLPTDYTFKLFPQTRLEPILDFDSNESKRPMYRTSFGNYLRVGLASNPSSLAEMPADFVIGDEIDEIKETLKLDPKELARNRLRTAFEPKEILSSTPKIMNAGITKEFELSKRHEIEMPCPHCSKYFIVTWEMFKYPEEATADEVAQDRLAWIECQHCGEEILDEHHEQMVRSQRWVCIDPEMRNRIVGFKKRVWNTIFMSWSDVVAKYLEVKHAQDRLSDFYHSYCAEVIDTFTQSKQMEKNALTSDYFRENKEIPAECQFLTAGVDLGKNEAWLTLLGWGPHGEVFELWDCRIEREPGHEGWLKMCRGIEHAVNVDEFKYLGDGEKPYFVGGLFDSGFDTALVYEFCKLNPLWFPVKGDSNTPRPFELSMADPKRRYGGRYSGLQLYLINPHHWEDVLQTMLETGSGANGFNVPGDVHDRYIQHLNASVRKFIEDTKGKTKAVWAKKHRSSENHLRDATYYAICYGFIKRLNTLKAKDEIKKEKKLIPKKPAFKSSQRMRF